MVELIMSLQVMFLSLQTYIEIQSQKSQLLVATRLRRRRGECRLCLRRQVITLIKDVLILHNEHVSVSLCLAT